MPLEIDIDKLTAEMKPDLSALAQGTWRCKTCAYWDATPTWGRSDEWGGCFRINDDDSLFLVGGHEWEYFATAPDFGCVQYVSKGD
jgi:hypothetical protein